MKTSIALLSVIAAIAHSVYAEERSAASAELGKISIPYEAECIVESRVTKTQVDQFYQSGYIPKDKKMENYLRCIMYKSHLINEKGELLIDNIIKALNIKDPVLIAKLKNHCKDPRSDACRNSLNKGKPAQKCFECALQVGASIVASIEAQISGYFGCSGFVGAQ